MIKLLPAKFAKFVQIFGEDVILASSFFLFSFFFRACARRIYGESDEESLAGGIG